MLIQRPSPKEACFLLPITLALCIAQGLSSLKWSELNVPRQSQVTSHRQLADSEASNESTWSMEQNVFDVSTIWAVVTKKKRKNGRQESFGWSSVLPKKKMTRWPRLWRLRSHSSSRPAIRHLQHGTQEVARKNVECIPSSPSHINRFARFSPILGSILHALLGHRPVLGLGPEPVTLEAWRRRVSLWRLVQFMDWTKFTAPVLVLQHLEPCTWQLLSDYIISFPGRNIGGVKKTKLRSWLGPSSPQERSWQWINDICVCFCNWKQHSHFQKFRWTCWSIFWTSRRDTNPSHLADLPPGPRLNIPYLALEPLMIHIHYLHKGNIRYAKKNRNYFLQSWLIKVHSAWSACFEKCQSPFCLPLLAHLRQFLSLVTFPALIPPSESREILWTGLESYRSTCATNATSALTLTVTPRSTESTISNFKQISWCMQYNIRYQWQSQ